MGNEGSHPPEDSTWSQTYNEIKTQHDKAFYIIQEAINLEENQQYEQALEKYKSGIVIIDSILRIQVTCPNSMDSTWENACKMIQKIKKARAHVVNSINHLQEQNSVIIEEPPEEPPSYEEVMSDSDHSEYSMVTYNDLANALSQIQIDSSQELAPEVVYMFENVRLYFISPDGGVTMNSEGLTLKIILLDDEGENVPRAILQIGPFVYPLIPGVSPCYRTEYNAFIIPNVSPSVPQGSSIGLIFPPDTDEDAYDLLEGILHGIIGEVKRSAPRELSQKISSGIVTGASYLSQGLVFGAEKLGNMLNTTTPKLISKMDSANQPTEIPRRVSKSMQVASCATNKAAKVTGYVADQIGVATTRLGKFLAPHIQKQGTRLLTNGFKMSEADASAKVSGVLTVAAGAVEGFSTVYRGLENSAGILGQSLKENTVKVVQHKYGQPAGAFAGDTLSTVGNVYKISQNAKIVQPKHLVKKTAKEAGKAFITPNYSRFDLPGPGEGTSSQNFPSSVGNELDLYDKDLPPKKN